MPPSRSMFSSMSVKGKFLAGMYTESDGRGEPFKAVPALARAARRAGAVIAENCAVRTLDVEGGRFGRRGGEAHLAVVGPVMPARASLAGGGRDPRLGRHVQGVPG